MDRKKLWIRLIIILSLIGILSITTIPRVSLHAANADIQNLEEPKNEQTPSPDITPAIASKLSGEVLTCTNMTDVEKVIDIRLSNLDVYNQSISIFPLAKTVDLLPKQIKRIDLPLLYGVSTLKLVSSNGEVLTVGVPPCVSGGSSGRGSQNSFSSSTGEPFKSSPPVPELPTIALTGLGMFGLILVLSRRKQ